MKRIYSIVFTLLMALLPVGAQSFPPGTTVTMYVGSIGMDVAYVYTGNSSDPTPTMVSLIGSISPSVSGNPYFRFEGYNNADMSDSNPAVIISQGSPAINAATTTQRWWRVRAAMTKEGLDDPEQYIVSELKYFHMFTDDDICRQGMLLFKEDFGGNELSDPPIRTDGVRGVFPTGAKIQTTNGAYNAGDALFVHSNRYMITKRGFATADTLAVNPSSSWFIQDDHTHPDDYRRGYFLEVNGRDGNELVYRTTLKDLCPGTPLTFTAYIANVCTPTYSRWYVYYGNPVFRMVVTDAYQDTVIQEFKTPEIPIYNNASWRASSPWRLYGFPFVVPEGVRSVEFAIYNAAAKGLNGVDYAIDDIEIHRCDAPIPHISSAYGAYEGSEFTLTSAFENNGFFTEPLLYRWQYSANSWDWTEVGTEQNLVLSPVEASHEGYYRVLIGDAATIESENCCAISDKIYFRVLESKVHTLSKELHPDATCHVRNDFDSEQGGVLTVNNPYRTYPIASLTIEDIMPGLRYAFEAKIANAGAGTKLRFVIVDPKTEFVVGVYETELITDTEWQLEGTAIIVPDYVYGLRLDLYEIAPGNNRSTQIDHLAIRLAAPPISISSSAEALCTSNPYINFRRSVYPTDGSLGSKLAYRFESSEDSLVWRTLVKGNYRNYTQRPKNLKEGWYRVSVARIEDLELPHCCVISEPIYMQKIEGGCTPFAVTWPDEVSDDVCPRGTLLFREDFGGNDPSDPITSKEKLTTMSTNYRQASDVYSTVGQGLYVVAKHGFQNNWEGSTTLPLSSQWFVQDDHTYPNDYTRGYLLEVDGKGGNDAFYSTTLPVCHEQDLSFSAYVANVLEPGHNFARPKVRFLITDELTGDTIWEQSSGAIEPAPADYGEDGPAIVRSAPWHLVGASFHVPSGTSLIRLSIFNDEDNYTGNDFAMDDIEIRLCKPEVTVNSDHEICIDSAYTFAAQVTADGGFQEPYEYLWQFAKDSLPFNGDGWENRKKGLEYTISAASLEDEGWYRLCVTSNGVDVETERSCRAMSEPFHLTLKDCTPCPELKTERIDTVVCDTLMPYLWRGRLYTEPGSVEELYKNIRDCDSLQRIFTLSTERCCPELMTEVRDTTVCDTLMPYLWRGELFTAPGTKEIRYKNTRDCDSMLYVYTLQTERCCRAMQTVEIDTVVCDTLMPYFWRGKLYTEPATDEQLYKNARGCDSLLGIYTLTTELCCPALQYVNHDTVVCDTLLPIEWDGLMFHDIASEEVMNYDSRGCETILHTYTLDTIHCERLWLIIVNKYNWQLLCDNVALRRFFPNRTAMGFQWYKDGTPVLGATEDDYAEQNELHGTYQLRVTLDGGQMIWSNIIELLDTPSPEPIFVEIYDSKGVPVMEDQVTHGIYLYRYTQGERTWTEKKLIP